MRSDVAIVAFLVFLNSLGVLAQQQVDKGCCVAIALDESTSLTDDDFKQEKDFVASLIANFDKWRQPNGQYAGVCVYSTSVLEVFRISTVQTKQQAVTKIGDLLLEGGLTNTHLAIDKLVDYLSECPSDYNKAGLVITDGNANFPGLTQAAADRFKALGYLLIVVGVGDIKADQLRAIATPGYYRGVANFASLARLTKQIEEELCSDWKTTTTTTTPTTTTTTPTTTTTTPTTTTTTPTTTTTTPTTTTTTPTTTTTTPTTTTTTPKPPATTERCLDCEFINGLYIFRSKRYCYIYNQCLSWQQEIPYERPCPFSQFFEPWAATCMLADQIDCPHDPCKDGIVVSYPNHLVCSSYFMCNGSRTVREVCCASGERFILGSGCVPDPTCKDPCRPPPLLQLCVSRAHPDDDSKYQDNVGSNIWVTRDCAPGTKFDATTCRCSEPAPMKPKPDCNHELYLPFENNVQDYMYRRYVTNNDPKVTIQAVPGATGSKAAVFSGNNGLLVKSYDNAWFGQTLVIRTRFRETGTLSPPRKEAIFGNGDCSDKDGSVGMFYYRSTNRVEAVVVTWNNDMAEVITRVFLFPVSSGSWKSCEYRYDGSTLQLTCDGNVASAPASGNIATRHAALQIGKCCGQQDNFIGYQDEFYVYPCLP